MKREIVNKRLRTVLKGQTSYSMIVGQLSTIHGFLQGVTGSLTGPTFHGLAIQNFYGLDGGWGISLSFSGTVRPYDAEQLKIHIQDYGSIVVTNSVNAAYISTSEALATFLISKLGKQVNFTIQAV